MKINWEKLFSLFFIYVAAMFLGVSGHECSMAFITSLFVSLFGRTFQD
jgi:hypothetical protein